MAERYPWDEWLDGQTRALDPGTDFADVSPTPTINTIRRWVNQAATRAGVKVRTKTVAREDRVLLLVSAQR